MKLKTQTRVNNIATLNNLKNPNLIKPGDRLKTPDSVIPDITDDLMAKMKKTSQIQLLIIHLNLEKKLEIKVIGIIKIKKELYMNLESIKIII